MSVCRAGHLPAVVLGHVVTSRQSFLTTQEDNAQKPGAHRAPQHPLYGTNGAPGTKP